MAATDAVTVARSLASEDFPLGGDGSDVTVENIQSLVTKIHNIDRTIAENKLKHRNDIQERNSELLQQYQIR